MHRLERFEHECTRSFLRQITLLTAMTNKLWVEFMDDDYRFDHVHHVDHLQTFRWYDPIRPFNRLMEIDTINYSLGLAYRIERNAVESKLISLRRSMRINESETSVIEQHYVQFHDSVLECIQRMNSIEPPQAAAAIHIGGLFDVRNGFTDEEQEREQMHTISNRQMRVIQGLLLKLRDIKQHVKDNETWNEFPIINWKEAITNIRVRVAGWLNSKIDAVLVSQASSMIRGRDDEWENFSVFISHPNTRSDITILTDDEKEIGNVAGAQAIVFTPDEQKAIKQFTNINDYFAGCMSNSKDMTTASLFKECTENVLQPLRIELDNLPDEAKNKLPVKSFVEYINRVNRSLDEKRETIINDRASHSHMKWDAIRARVWRLKVEQDIKGWTNRLLDQFVAIIRSRTASTNDQFVMRLRSVINQAIDDKGDFNSGACVTLEGLELGRIATFDRSTSVLEATKGFQIIENSLSKFLKDVLEPLQFVHRSKDAQPEPYRSRHVVARRQNDSSSRMDAAAMPRAPPVSLPPLPLPRVQPRRPSVNFEEKYNDNGPVRLPPLDPLLRPTVMELDDDDSKSDDEQQEIFGDRMFRSIAMSMAKDFAQRSGLEGEIQGVDGMDIKCRISSDARLKLCTLLKQSNIISILSPLIDLAEFRHRREVLEKFYHPSCNRDACSLRDAWKAVKAFLVLCVYERAFAIHQKQR